jgi:hypothetical protein
MPWLLAMTRLRKNKKVMDRRSGDVEEHGDKSMAMSLL